ncbi:MAG: formate dehydrogenase accessory sulfurtransferase FdhD, partial [Nocardioides sp.]
MSTPPLARRPGPSTRVRVREHTAGSAVRQREDRLATEEPLEIRLQWPGAPAQRVWVTMRSPGNDFELAVGNLFHEGFLQPADLGTVAYCTDADLTPEEEFNVVTVSLRVPPLRVPSAHAPSSAACGVCGKDNIQEALHLVHSPGRSHEPLDLDTVRALPEQLRTHQRLFDRTGGVHAAALASAGGEILVIREDVGRHNAVDKLAGARILAHEEPSAA